MIAVAPALAGFCPLRIVSHSDAREYGGPMPEARPAAVLARSGEPAPAATEAAMAPEHYASSDYPQVIEILRLLESAKAKLTKKVADIIKESEREMAEAEKKAFANRKIKLENLTKKIIALKLKVEQLRTLSPRLRIKYQANIEAALRAANGLVDSSGELDANFDAAAGNIENQIAAIENEVAGIERALKNDPSLGMLFGADWTLLFRSGAYAFNDGVIEANELSAEGRRRFIELGLLRADGKPAIAADGLTSAEAADAALAKKEYAIFLTALIGKKGIAAAEVEAAVNRLMQLAARGEFTEENVNQALKPLGVEFNKHSFSWIWTGQADRLFHTERLTSLQAFCRRVHALMGTFEMVSEEGVSVDWNRMESPSPDNENYRKDVAQRAHNFMVSYANAEDFTPIDFEAHRGMIYEALRAKFGLTSGSWKEFNKQKLSIQLRALANEINEKTYLSEDQKWELLTRALLRELYTRHHLKVTAGEKEPDKRRTEEIKAFLKLATGVQKANPGSAVRKAYIEQLQKVFMSDDGMGSGVQTIDVDAVLNAPEPSGTIEPERIEPPAGKGYRLRSVV